MYVETFLLHIIKYKKQDKEHHVQYNPMNM